MNAYCWFVVAVGVVSIVACGDSVRTHSGNATTGVAGGGGGAGGTTTTTTTTTTAGEGGQPAGYCSVDADCATGTDCRSYRCMVVCEESYAEAGTPCNEYGGTVCDGGGNCVECVEADDCVSPEPCINHQCMPCGNGLCDPGDSLYCPADCPCDSPVLTPCAGVECDTATQICIIVTVSECGGTASHQCVPLPVECADDRTCECIRAASEPSCVESLGFGCVEQACPNVLECFRDCG